MNDEQMLRETYQLAKDNNRMLHAMRRNAFISGVFRVIIWAILIVAPIWFYAKYIAPVMQSMLDTYSQIQGTSAQAQAQFSQFQDLLKKLTPGQ